MYTDPEGKFGVVFWTCVVLGVGIGMIGGYSIGRSNGLTGWDLFGATIGGGIVGGLLGAAGGYFIEAFLLGGGASGLSIGALSGGGFGLALSNGYTIATAAVQTLSIATAAGVAGTLMVFSDRADRFVRKDKRPNYVQNKEFRDVINKYNRTYNDHLSYDTIRDFHDYLMKKGIKGFNRLYQALLEWLGII